MKKLMIALAVVAMGFAANAAKVSWGISGIKLPTGTDGKYDSKTSVGDAGRMAIYLVNAEDFANATAANIFETYSTKTADYGSLTADAGKTSTMGTLTLTSSDTYKANDDVYAIMIVSYTDANKKQWYVVNKAQAKINESMGVAQDATIGSLNTKFGGSGDAVNFGGTFGSDITGWTAVAVPEPTSGLLLLLGVAGLALRRKQK